MLSQTFFTVSSAIVMFAMLAIPTQALPVDQELAAAAPAACLGFRITSPVKSGLKWTYGQCYSADWDLGASQVTTITSVQLVDAKTKKVVATEAKNIAGSKLTTGNFPLLMGDDVNADNYYFQVNGKTSSGSTKTCSLNSVTFHVEVNPNSPPETNCRN
ncbi:hypothetical protein BCR42DRAFT_15743 [Absidia repens]|uniref:Uncharacterized protein n=1 Tax=Absidia repens TaxID=90262 RepID=A0A1X2J213_9FUNG|nr:hypothetical protein BCR42DRAFT_15743 [Absidia repens]